MPRGVVVREFEHEGQRFLVLGWSAPRPAALFELTPGECEIALAWVEGADAKTLARRRGVSRRTIFNQVQAVYRKLRVGTREELLRLVQGFEP